MKTALSIDSLSVTPIRTAQKLPAKKQVAEAELTHADSTFFYTTNQPSLSQTLLKYDVANHIQTSQYEKALKTDTIATHTQTTSATLVTPTPRATTPLHQYSSIAVLSSAIVIVILLILKSASKGFLSGTLSFFVNGRAWKKIENDSSLQMYTNVMLLNLTFYIAISVFAIETILIYIPSLLSNLDLLSLTGYSAIALFAFFMLRYIFDTILAYAFDASHRMKLIKLYNKTICSVMGLILVPFIIILPFIPQTQAQYVIMAIVIVAILLFVLRFIKTMQINMSNLSSILYFILYLCIVEIAPVICAVRLLAIIG